MAASSSLNVISVHCAVLEGCRGALDEAGLVQGVAVDLALDVVLVADSDALLAMASLSLKPVCHYLP